MRTSMPHERFSGLAKANVYNQLQLHKDNEELVE